MGQSGARVLWWPANVKQLRLCGVVKLTPCTATISTTVIPSVTQDRAWRYFGPKIVWKCLWCPDPLASPPKSVNNRVNLGNKISSCKQIPSFFWCHLVENCHSIQCISTSLSTLAHLCDGFVLQTVANNPKCSEMCPFSKATTRCLLSL